MGAIFLSHASADSEAAAGLARRLGAWGHRSLFLDFHPEQGIPAGADWEAELYRRLKLCRAVVALVSDAWLASRWCFAEATQARALGKPVVPVLIAPCAPGGSLFADRQTVDLTGDRESGLGRLRRGLEALGLGADLPFDPERPYPGLASFGETDAGVYFGRGPERDRLLDLLRRMRRRGEPRLAVVLGASGCGKSSLVRAGVLPRLRRDAESWLVVPPFRPGGDPRRALANALDAAFDAAGAPRGWRAVYERLEGDGRPWTTLADGLRQAAGRRDATVLLVVDQLEELLTAPDASFLAVLTRELSEPGGPVLALATLRSDFLAAFQQRPELRDLPFADLPLGPMPLARLPRVIEGPAARVGLEIEEGLTARLARDTARDDALPLLAFALRELWERRRQDRWTFELYERELGTIEGAVGRIAEEVAGDLSAAEENALRAAFLRLVRLDDEGRPVRRPARWDDLPRAAHPRLERFVADRLLVATDLDGERSVEVAHESLYRAWDRLARWLDEARELLLFRRRLSRALHEWRRTGEDPGALLRGAALAEAERWLDERRDDLDDDERRYVTASVTAERRRRRRVVVGLAAGLLAAVAVTVAMAFLWLGTERERERADQERQRAEQALRLAVARQLAVQADAELDDSADGLVRSLLLATESLRSAWTHDGYGAWARAVALLPRRAEKTFPAEGIVTALAAHPERSWVALAADGEGGVRVLDVLTGHDVAVLDHPSPTHILRFSPDGKWLAAAVGDRITVWRVSTWRLTRRIQGYGHTRDIVFTGEESNRGPGLVAAQTEFLVDLPPVADDDLPPPLGVDGYAMSAAFHPQAAGAEPAAPTLALGTQGEVWLWRQPWRLDPARASILPVGSQSHVEALEFTADGAFLVAASDDRVCLGDLSSGPAWGGFGDGACLSADGGRVRHLGLPGRGRVLTQATGAPADLRLWRYDSHEVARLPIAGSCAFALQNVGDWVATAGDGVDLHPIDSLAARGATARLPPASVAAFSGDGRWLAGARAAAEVWVQHVGSWREELRAPLSSRTRAALGFTPGYDRLVVLDGRIVRLFAHREGSWEAAEVVDTGELDLRVAVSPDGRLLRTHAPYVGNHRYRELSRPSRTRIWDLESGEVISWRSHEEDDVRAFLVELEKIGWAPPREELEISWEQEGWRDEKDAFALGEGGRVEVLDRAAGWPQVALDPPRNPTSPGNRWTARSNGVLAEPGTRREIVSLGVPGEHARALAFGPDLGAGSEWLAVATSEATRVYRLGPVDALVAEACRRLPRNLRAEEWPLDGEPPVTCPDL